MNMRLQDGDPVFEGDQIQLGGSESYVPACYMCWSHRRAQVLVADPGHEGLREYEGPSERDPSYRSGENS
jgi:hypothetical protein